MVQFAQTRNWYTIVDPCADVSCQQARFVGFVLSSQRGDRLGSKDDTGTLNVPSSYHVGSAG
ncbi:hypothetical protein ACFPVT_10125 [Corynebacterium choanae]|uniref:hypothetical protein n=1 Tax=Corynebacterium choanae TaxID=1862358 RepID=UPI000F4E6E65|nr:hypothetical protein [Corynebacterium choanae]